MRFLILLDRTKLTYFITSCESRQGGARILLSATTFTISQVRTLTDIVVHYGYLPFIRTFITVKIEHRVSRLKPFLQSSGIIHCGKFVNRREQRDHSK